MANNKRYKAHIDVMHEGKWLHTFRNVQIDTTFCTWVDELLAYIFEKRPSFKDLDRFDLFWKVPGETEDAHMTVTHNKNKMPKAVAYY